MFLWTILLALIWAAVTGRFDWTNLLIGLVIAHGVLFIAQPIMGRSNYFGRIRHVIGFALFYLREMILANLRVAYDVMTPLRRIRPGVIAIPLEARTDAEIALLANLITLTPGSVSLDVSSDRRFLYLHAMYIEDLEKYRADVKRVMERRVLQVMR